MTPQTLETDRHAAPRPRAPRFEMRAVRGASGDNTARTARLDARAGLSRRGRHNIYVGFRCARN